MYSIERIHIDDATADHFQILQTPSVGKTIVIYDETAAMCRHYTGCPPTSCATMNCMYVAQQTEQIIQDAGFRL